MAVDCARPSSSHFIFVYGTLKRGFRNHYNMENRNISYVGSGATLDSYPLYMDEEQRNRPCLANLQGVGHTVRGEVYEVTSEQLEELDEFERCPTHYHRQLVPVKADEGGLWEAGDTVWVSAYFINIQREGDGAEIQEKIQTKLRLLDDYTFEHHRLYVSRKELEALKKKEEEKKEEETQTSTPKPCLDMLVRKRTFDVGMTRVASFLTRKFSDKFEASPSCRSNFVSPRSANRLFRLTHCFV